MTDAERITNNTQALVEIHMILKLINERMDTQRESIDLTNERINELDSRINRLTTRVDDVFTQVCRLN